MQFAFVLGQTANYISFVWKIQVKTKPYLTYFPIILQLYGSN